MKYEPRLIADTGLPDAPLAMPKQNLERHGGLFTRLRQMLAAFNLL